MPKIRLTVMVCIVCFQSYGQGTILFDNHIPGVVDARFYLPDGTGFGAGWTAQLFFSPSLTANPTIALFPTTRFKTSSEAETGSVVPVVVTVPNALPGTTVRVLMGATLDANPAIFAQANSVIVILGGDGTPPALLVGLMPIGFSGIPEPSTITLWVIGAGMLLFFRRR